MIKWEFDNCSKQTQQIKFENIYIFEKKVQENLSNKFN